VVVFASPSDVSAVYGPIDAVKVQDWIDYASAVVRRRVPSIEDRVSSGETDPVLVRGVVVRMVLRALENPTGRRQTSVGDVSTSFDASTMLFLTEDEAALLRPEPTRRPWGMARIGAALAQPAPNLNRTPWGRP
jgi:hypothetical protein